MAAQENSMSGVSNSLKEWVNAEKRFSEQCQRFVEVLDANMSELPLVYQSELKSLVQPFRDLASNNQNSELGSIDSPDDVMSRISQLKESLLDGQKEASHQKGIQSESQLNSLMHKLAELNKDCFKKMVCAFEGKEKKVINPKYFDKVTIELTQQLAKRKEIAGNICKTVGKIASEDPELNGFAGELQTLADKYGNRVNAAKGENISGKQFNDMRDQVLKGLEKFKKSNPQYGGAVAKAGKLLKAIDFDGTASQSKNAMKDVAFALGSMKMGIAQVDRAKPSASKKGGVAKLGKIEKTIEKSDFNKFNQKKHAASYQDMQSKASVELKAASIQPSKPEPLLVSVEKKTSHGMRP